MGRKRMSTIMNVSGKFEADLVVKFGNLAQSNGVTMREALRRVMVRTVLEGRIPGIDSLELEQRENQKWGTATPIYDGESSPKQKNIGAQVTPKLPAE